MLRGNTILEKKTMQNAVAVKFNAALCWAGHRLTFLRESSSYSKNRVNGKSAKNKSLREIIHVLPFTPKAAVDINLMVVSR